MTSAFCLALSPSYMDTLSCSRLYRWRCPYWEPVPIPLALHNNWPRWVQAVSSRFAGMAAGLVACDMRDGKTVLRQAPRLEVRIEGVTVEGALVDVVVSSLPFVG